jgi:hypothetical protein
MCKKLDLPVYKPLGNFIELQAFDLADAISIHDAICESPHEKEKEIFEYLEKGERFLSMMGAFHDVIDGKSFSGYDSYSTDGIWNWRSDLPYYIRKYHVRLSDEFMIYLQGKNWGTD